MGSVSRVSGRKRDSVVVCEQLLADVVVWRCLRRKGVFGTVQPVHRRLESISGVQSRSQAPLGRAGSNLRRSLQLWPDESIRFRHNPER